MLLFGPAYGFVRNTTVFLFSTVPNIYDYVCISAILIFVSVFICLCSCVLYVFAPLRVSKR